MRVIIALAVLVCLSLGGCSRANQAAYAKPLPSPLPHPTKASSVKPGPLPVRKLSAPTNTSSVNSPTLPSNKPPQIPSASVQSPTTAEAKFKAAQEKAKLSGVHTLTQKDIDGLTYDQIKELRGY
jgi:hypothetical protein